MSPTAAGPAATSRLTPEGLAAIEAHRAEHARLWQGFDRVLRARKA